MNPQRWIGLLSVIALVSVMAPAGLTDKAWAFETKSNSSGMVTVQVTPKQLAPGQAARFQISMSTHSVDLDQDLTAVSTLTDDQGGTYQPEKWAGSPPGGHHRAGELIFPALKADVQSIKLVISNVAGVPERVYHWDMNK
ncbi:MAG: hypothetical protein V1742_03950 [Pseudomonadota bacterium]